MPRLKNSVPRYRKHKQSGRAIVTLNGRDYLLGPHGTQVSRTKYDQLLLRLYENEPAAEFGPMELKVVSQSMVDAGWARTYVSQQTGVVVPMFK